MKKKESFKRRFLRVVGTPEFIIREQPEICMLGFECISIENYKSLLEYNDSNVLLRLVKGKAQIEGRKLMVKSIEEGKICIEGHVTKVCFIEGD